MKRRSFLKFLGALSAAPAVAKIPVAEAVEQAVKAVEAPAVQEAAYVHVAYSLGFIVEGIHPKALWPGLQQYWGRVYDQLDSTPYPPLFTKDN